MHLCMRIAYCVYSEADVQQELEAKVLIELRSCQFQFPIYWKIKFHVISTTSRRNRVCDWPRAEGQLFDSV